MRALILGGTELISGDLHHGHTVHGTPKLRTEPGIRPCDALASSRHNCNQTSGNPIDFTFEDPLLAKRGA